jgi:RNA polymerase sigma factor (sigma-70 family)
MLVEARAGGRCGVTGDTLGDVMRRLGRSAGLQGDLALPDELLLERFARRRDGPAFAALVTRHGPMVYGVCRRLLRDVQEAEDAFQAAFLVLARKAAAIRRRTLLAAWLYGVARKVAARLRGQALRRRTRERQAVDLNALAAPEDDTWSDVRPVVHDEVRRLPERYRASVVLCYLEGKTHEEAAAQLRAPLGTVKSHLTRARELLRSRLARRGLALSAPLLAAALAVSPARAAPALVDATLGAAAQFAAGRADAGLVSARAAALTHGVLRVMMWNKLRLAAAAALAVCALGLGAGWWAGGPARTEARDRAAEKPATAEKPKDDKDLIRGVWRVTSVEMDGKESAEEARKLTPVRWVFSADKLTLRAEGAPDDATAYKLDPSKNPKQIDIVGKESVPPGGVPSGEAPPSKPGIYILDGDSLTICLPNTPEPGRRPIEFKTREGGGTVLLKFKREADKDKPADKPAPAEGKADEKRQKLLQDWCAAGKKAFDLRKEEFLAGTTTSETFIGTARRLLAAELERGATKADRVAAYEAHLGRVTDFVQVVKAKVDAGRLAPAEAVDAEYYRLEAEVLLEREKAK